MSRCIKIPVNGHVVKLLHHKQSKRGMELIEHSTRCVQQHQIHELVTTDHQDLKPGDRVDSVGFLGFAELTNGGIIEQGDKVLVDKQPIGTVAGFDECHWPNHYNIIIQTSERLTADDIDLALGAEIQFRVEDE